MMGRACLGREFGDAEFAGPSEAKEGNGVGRAVLVLAPWRRQHRLWSAEPGAVMDRSG